MILSKFIRSTPFNKKYLAESCNGLNMISVITNRTKTEAEYMENILTFPSLPVSHAPGLRPREA